MGISGADPAPKFNVVVAPVREVTLRGAADLEFWRQRLAGEGLSPASFEGCAHVMICAAEARFLTIRFREVSLSIFVAKPPSEDEAGVFLTQAFNSVRLFAFVERTFFRTPYQHAEVRIHLAPSPGIEVRQSGQSLLSAQMAMHSGRSPLRQGEEGWTGPILLPDNGRRGAERKMFFGKMWGEMETYPFTPEDDFTLRPATLVPALQWLIDCNFAPQEWNIRRAGTHAKSKTVRRAF